MTPTTSPRGSAAAAAEAEAPEDIRQNRRLAEKVLVFAGLICEMKGGMKDGMKGVGDYKDKVTISR